ncbi:MAG: glycosyltransferase [Bacteroidales bacterium]|nr:glycosyltransferase [Bacteroidales bacterium]
MAKILHISKFYHPYFGGIEDVARALVKEMSKCHEQRIICFNHTNETVDEVVDNIPITRVGIVGTLSSQPIALGFAKHLKRVLRVFHPDFIHLHLPNPLAAFVLQTLRNPNYKIVVHWHSDILGQRLVYPFYKGFEHKLLRSADKIIVTSDAYKNGSKALSNFLEKTIVIPNIVSEEKLQLQLGDEQRMSTLRQQWENKNIVLFVGRHVEYKGLRYLIEIEKQITSDCVILVAGEGPQTSLLKELAVDSHRIHFIGRLTNEQLRCYLHIAKVFAFPSYLRSEAFGVALAEAMYCGLPAVSFAIEGSGVTWVNQNEKTGFVIPNLNIQAFAEAVDRLLTDEALRRQMGAAATAWIKQNFLKQNILPGLSVVYGNEEQTIRNDKTGILNASIVLFRNNFAAVTKLVKVLSTSRIVNTVFLVDNSPNPDERYRELPVEYIYTGENLGYGRGHNEAIYRSFHQNVPYHLALNADVNFEANALEKMVAEMEKNISIGAMMPKVFYPNGELQHLCRLLPTPLDLFGRRFLPNCWMAKRVSRLELRHTDYSSPLPIPHISGCFMLLRLAALSHVGLFDPRYFLYMEDVDLSRRIHQKYQTLFYPSVTIIHQHERGSYKTWHLLGVHVVSAIKYFNKWGWLHDAERDAINKKVWQLSHPNNHM